MPQRLKRKKVKGTHIAVMIYIFNYRKIIAESLTAGSGCGYDNVPPFFDMPVALSLMSVKFFYPHITDSISYYVRFYDAEFFVFRISGRYNPFIVKR